jgi:acetylornithine deacetylase/succinyl-diaminopimelate desuccinylase-like protein
MTDPALHDARDDGTNDRCHVRGVRPALREQTENLVSDGDRSLVRDLDRLAPAGVVLEIGSAHGRDAHNAVFLHFTPGELRRVLSRIPDVLLPDGVMGFTVKVGRVEHREARRTPVLPMPDAFTPRIEGDRLFARGAADMKGGVAGLVVAAEQLAHDDRGQVVVALVADEEDRSLGTEAVLAGLPGTGLAPDVALVAEPTHLDLTTSLRRFAVVEVEFLGRGAHTSQANEDVDAVAHLGLFLGAVVEARRPIEQRGGSLLVSVVSGGSAPFTVADRARATVERRTVAEEAGIPAVVCGPSGGGLHAVDEWVDLREVRAFPEAIVDAYESFAEREHRAD